MLGTISVNTRPEDVTMKKIAQLQGSFALLPLVKTITTCSVSGITAPTEDKILHLEIRSMEGQGYIRPDVALSLEKSLDEHAAIWTELSKY